MAVQRIVAGVEPSAAKPAIVRRITVVQHPVPTPLPLDRLRRLAPEAFRIAQRTRMHLVEQAHVSVPSSAAVVLGAKSCAKRIGGKSRRVSGLTKAPAIP